MGIEPHHQIVLDGDELYTYGGGWVALLLYSLRPLLKEHLHLNTTPANLNQPPSPVPPNKTWARPHLKRFPRPIHLVQWFCLHILQSHSLSILIQNVLRLDLR